MTPLTVSALLDKSVEDREEAIVREYFDGSPCCTLGPNRSAGQSRTYYYIIMTSCVVLHVATPPIPILMYGLRVVVCLQTCCLVVFIVVPYYTCWTRAGREKFLSARARKRGFRTRSWLHFVLPVPLRTILLPQ